MLAFPFALFSGPARVVVREMYSVNRRGRCGQDGVSRLRTIVLCPLAARSFFQFSWNGVRWHHRRWAGPQDTRPRGPAQHPGGHHASNNHTRPVPARRDPAVGRGPGLRRAGAGGRAGRFARPAHGHPRQPGQSLGPRLCPRRNPVLHRKMPRPVGAHPGRRGPPPVRRKRCGRGRRRPVLPGPERHARPGPGPGLCRQPAPLPVHGLETWRAAGQPGGSPAGGRGQHHGARSYRHRHRHPL